MIDTNEYLADALKFLQTEAKEIKKEEEKEEDLDEGVNTSYYGKYGKLSQKQIDMIVDYVRNSGKKILSTDDISDEFMESLHKIKTFENLYTDVDRLISDMKFKKEEKEVDSKETEEEEVDERTDIECASDQLKKESKKTEDDEQEDEDEEEEEEIKEIDEDGKLLPLRKNDKEGLVTVTASESKKDDEKEEEIDEEADKRTPLEFWRDMWSRYKDVFAWARVIKTYYDPEKDALKDAPVDNIKEDTSVVDKLKNLLKTAKGSISVDDLKDILGASTIAKEGVEMEEKEEELDESKMGEVNILIGDLKKKGLKGDALVKAVASELEKTLKDKSKAEEVAKGLLGEEKEDEDETKEEKIEESLKRVASLLV